jgi:hypothetical protein
MNQFAKQESALAVAKRDEEVFDKVSKMNWNLFNFSANRNELLRFLSTPIALVEPSVNITDELDFDLEKEF